MLQETLEFESPRYLLQLLAGREQHLQDIESTFDIQIVSREGWIRFEGKAPQVKQAAWFMQLLSTLKDQGIHIQQSDFHYILKAVQRGETKALQELYENPLRYTFPRKTIIPKTLSQKRYLQAMESCDIVMGIGPAGTGKTYLAVANALHSLQKGLIEKIVLTRPAVEAGEALGFLPGELEEKILPYLRPLYDALHDLIGKEDAARLMEKGIIDIAPLAYMRGRTLSRSCIILDEAQNTTQEQMMMFLTRLGDGSRMIVTGDITQIDLPRQKPSGLKQAIHVLRDIEGIKLFYFESTDVVRHPLVQRIVQAYSRHHDHNNSH
jgi:phosphate starvation-inducible PhoH-like protein